MGRTLSPESSVNRIASPSPSKKRDSGRLNVLIFKDNLSARNFQVPLTWISRFGMALAALMAVTVVASYLAVRFYVQAKQANPSRLQELQHELADLKSSYNALESKVSSATKSTTPAASSVSSNPSIPVPDQQKSEMPSNQPEFDVNRTTSSLGIHFSALPSTVTSWSKSAGPVPVTINAPQARWSGKSIRVHFAIQYTGPEKGSQQGKIIVVSRSPDALYAYPRGILSGPNESVLINPEQGEHFSVSRFRQVDAELGPFASQLSSAEVEILILSSDHKILAYQRIKPQSRSTASETVVPPPAQAPAPSTAVQEDSQSDDPNQE